MEDVDTAGFCRTSWTPDALPPAQLTAEETAKYRLLASRLLANTLRDYDIYNADPRQRRMSRRRWKPVKTRDHITVYKERHPLASASAMAASTRVRGPAVRTNRVSFADRLSSALRGGDEWTEPKLLVATGWIEGSLGDVMYGVASPDARGMLLKATVVKNTLINGAVLSTIDAPSAEDPLRFLGLKWFIKGPPAALQGIVRPRDLVFIEATGVLTRPNGERVGYQLLHSVDPPQYRGLTPQSAVECTRGRISSCSIFREIPGGQNPKVDVYVKGYVEAHGKLLDSVALTAASTGFLSSWNTVECANLKKLLWCFRQQSGGRVPRRSGPRGLHRRRRSNASSSGVSCSSAGSNTHSHLSRSSHDVFYQATFGLETASTCGTCSKRLGKLASSEHCALCSRATCSRCCVPRTLKEVNSALQLRQEDVLICKRCVLSVDRLAAVDVARAEVQEGWFAASGSSSASSLTSFSSTAVATDTTGSGSALPAEDEPSLSVLSPSATEGAMDSFRGAEPLSVSNPTSQLQEIGKEDVKKSAKPLSDHQRREQIWSQMVELRMVAESIYQLTLETTESLNVASRPSATQDQ